MEMEKITFRFEGSFADNHTLNFYEAARFQYAAARLIVKLAQFRDNGKFAQKITDKSNREILMAPHKDGSFEIIALAPIILDATQHFLSTSISEMFSYIFERLLPKPSNSEIVEGLNSVKEIVNQFGKISENNSETINKALEIIKNDARIKEELHNEVVDALKAQLSSMEREREISEKQLIFSKIDSAREQELIRMASPLVQEMATPLRRSATRLNISTGQKGQAKNILFLNQKMADEIEITKVDEDITPLVVDIIQYNKETGWGKLRMDEYANPISFNVPSDLKDNLKDNLVAAMGRSKVYLQLYIARDKTRRPNRCIIVGILPMPSI